ncbi:MAG: autotransporter-associated beta strand repeat-containing protein [Kiritimatiellia bacterium]
MKRCVMFALLSLAVLNGRAAGTNLYFKTFVYLPTVNEFNSSNTWAYGDYKGSYLPGTDDTLYTLFYVTDLWTTRDWRIYFSESITNYKVIARAPLYGHHATFDLDQKTWSLLNDYALLGGRGGRIVLTNGFLNVSNKLTLSAGTDLPEVRTNGIWIATDMAINVGSTLQVEGIHAVLNGGANPALNRVTHSGQLIVAYTGTGIVSLCGGTYTNSVASSSMYHYVGHMPGSDGRLEVSGGTNVLSAQSAISIVGRQGRGTLSVSEGLTVFNGYLYVGYYAGGIGALEVTGGRLEGTTFQVGREGQGSFTCTGGEVNMTSSLSVGTMANGVGTVTISGGTVKTATDVPMGFAAGAVADLTLSGSGLLRCRRIYKVSNDVTAHAGLLCDGGTLQASTSLSNVIDVLDEVCLTTNGLVLDTDGKNVSVRSVLQNQTGQAGSLTKKGAGTLTLAAARTATGPVSVLAGTLVASNALAVAEGVSTVNGTLTLTSGALSIGSGAALAGTGAVSSLELAGNAVVSRAKADGAVTPLQADSLSTDGPLTVALTGYTVGDLDAMLPLIRTPSTVDVSQVTVTVDGQTLPGVRAVARVDQGQNVLGVKYFSGTLISVF